MTYIGDDLAGKDCIPPPLILGAGARSTEQVVPTVNYYLVFSRLFCNVAVTRNADRP